jgi:hypothetical protein
MLVIFLFFRNKVISEIVKATTYFRMVEWSVNYQLEKMWEEVVVAEYADLSGTLRKTTKYSNRIACLRTKIWSWKLRTGYATHVVFTFDIP